MQTDTKKSRLLQSLRAGLCPLLLLLLFVGFTAGRTLFVHVHLTPAGVTVAHSHPYAGHHDHSAKAYEAIDLLTAATLDLPAAVDSGISAPECPSTLLASAPAASAPAAEMPEGRFLRAPPAELTSTLS